MSNPTPPPRPDAVAAARNLTDAVNGFNERIDAVQRASEERDAALRTYGRRNRKYVMFDIALTVLVAFFGGVLVHAADQASQALTGVHRNSATVGDVHAANLLGCQLNNARLAKQQAALDAILTPASASRHKDKAEVDRYLAAARAQIAVAWKPRNCAAAYKLGK
jgi:hypothetical protein